MDQWDELTARYGPSVWRTICRLLGTAHGAEDPFQETFLEFFELSRRQVIKTEVALLTRIATRRAIDQIRLRARQRVRSQPLVESLPERARGPAEIAIGEESLNLLRQAIAELQGDEAAVFCLTQLEQMEPADVARVMDMTPNHVAVVLHRARKRLQGRFDARR